MSLLAPCVVQGALQPLQSHISSVPSVPTSPFEVMLKQEAQGDANMQDAAAQHFNEPSIPQQTQVYSAWPRSDTQQRFMQPRILLVAQTTQTLLFASAAQAHEFVEHAKQGWLPPAA